MSFVGNGSFIDRLPVKEGVRSNHWFLLFAQKELSHGQNKKKKT
jgi:hypothetical protein